VAVQSQLACAAVAEFPGSCVMGRPAASQYQ
jgi:hypothetical protein